MAQRTGGKSRLGRGLESLIAPRESAAAPEVAEGPWRMCPVDRIDPMEGQPRHHVFREQLEGLIESIRENGVIQPLIVREQGGRYTLIAGERRWHAAQAAGLKEVPVVVRDATDADAFAMALIENIQRQDLNPIEEASAYRRLLDEYGFTQDALGTRVGRSRSTITNSLRLLQLGNEIQRSLAGGEITPGHARAILSTPPELHAPFAERIVTEKLSVRDAEALAKRLNQEGLQALGPRSTPPKPVLTPQHRAVETQLREHFGARVNLKRRTNGKGVIEVHFANDSDLQALLDRIL